MIPKIDSRSRNAEVSTIVDKMHEQLMKYNFSNDAYLTTQINALSGNNELMKQVLNEASPASMLASKDEKRGQAFRAIYYEVQAKNYWPVEEIRLASNIIMDVLDQYGLKTIGLSYDEESANINALLVDLQKPSIKDAIGKIPMLEMLIKQLESDQQDFADSMLKTLNEKSEARQLVSASKLNRNITKQINQDIIVYLNAMAIAQPQTYKDCARVLTEIIEQHNRKVRNRRKEKEINLN